MALKQLCRLKFHEYCACGRVRVKDRTLFVRKRLETPDDQLLLGREPTPAGIREYVMEQQIRV